MHNSSNKKEFDILCLLIIIFSLIALCSIVIEKDTNNLPIPKELLLTVPIIASIGIIRFYRRFEKIIEILFGISGILTALSLCLDSIPQLANDLFANFMQNKIGYLSLNLIAALLIAKTCIMIADYIKQT